MFETVRKKTFLELFQNMVPGPAGPIGPPARRPAAALSEQDEDTVAVRRLRTAAGSV